MGLLGSVIKRYSDEPQPQNGGEDNDSQNGDGTTIDTGDAQMTPNDNSESADNDGGNGSSKSNDTKEFDELYLKLFLKELQKL